MSHEEQAKFSNDVDEQKPVFDELDAIYQNQLDTALVIPFQPEYVANPEIKKTIFPCRCNQSSPIRLAEQTVF